MVLRRIGISIAGAEDVQGGQVTCMAGRRA